MARQGTTYTMFFSLSIMTDQKRFDEEVVRTGVVPFHNLQATDWQSLGLRIRDTIMSDYPESRDRVSVQLFNDSLECATKPMLSGDQILRYLKTLIRRAQDGNFKADDLRTDEWMTTYTQSAPPQDFNGVVVIDDDGSEDVLEQAVVGMLKHFYTSGEIKYSGLWCLSLIFSGDLTDMAHFSSDMLDVFVQTFDHPFANDVRAVVFNEDQQMSVAWS